MSAVALAALLALGPIHSAGDEPPVPVPKGYVLQELDETGWIARPKNWFFVSRHTADGWVWNISKEDPAKGQYRTGVVISAFEDVRDAETPTATMVVQNFFAQQARDNKVLSKSLPRLAGGLERRCLDVLGRDGYHVRFTAYWDPTPYSGFVLIAAFSAPQDGWEKTKTVAQVMSDIAIADTTSETKKE